MAPAPVTTGFLGVGGVVLLGVLALLVYPPYLRALYFTQEQLVTFLITLAVFGLWWGHKWRHGDVRFFGGPLDYFALAAALGWTLSLAVAVNPRGAIQEAVKNLNYFLLYWLVAEQVRSRRSAIYRNPRPLLGGMFLGAVGVALIGLAAVPGLVSYNGAFVGGRIASTIQYANALAVFLAAAFYAGLAIWTDVPDQSEKPVSGLARVWRRMRTGVLASSAAILLLTFIFTLSRGAWLIFPITLVLFLILIGPGRRLRAGAYFVAASLAALAASPLLVQGVSTQRTAYVGAATLVAIMAGTGLGYLAEVYLRRSTRWKVFTAVGLVAVLVVSGALIVGLAVVRPLSLGHTAGETAGWKTLEQRLNALDASKGPYVLNVEVSSSGDAAQPYSWSVTVYGYDSNTGGVRILATATGKPTADWEQKQVQIPAAAGLNQVTVQLGSYYPGTQAAYRNISIQAADGRVVARPTFLLAKLLPTSLYVRVADFGLTSSSSESRLSFYGDALKIVRDYPFLGVGGGGWASAYQKYQTYGYISRETHSQLLQTWVDTGTLGLVAMLAFWLAFLVIGLRLLKNPPNSDPGVTFKPGQVRLLLGGIIATVVAIGAHSLIDFDLSLPAISIYFWALIGIVAGLGGTAEVHGVEKRGASPTGFAPEVGLPLVFVLLAFIFTARLLVGYSAGAQAAALLKAGSPGEAKAGYVRAVSYDPWNASFHVDLAQIEHSLGEAKRGVALDPFNAQYHQLLALEYLRQNDAADALNEFDRSAALAPFQQPVYQQLAKAEFSLAEELIQIGHAPLAKPFLQRVVTLSNQLVQQAALVPRTVPSEFRLSPDDPGLSLLVGEAQALLGQPSNAVAALTKALATPSTAQESDIWLAAVYSANGTPQQAKPYLEVIAAAGKGAMTSYANVLAMVRQGLK